MAAVEKLIDQGGKNVPHVGEIIGLCKQSAGHLSTQTHATVWEWAGHTLEGYERLPRSTKAMWEQRWAARIEAIYRERNQRIQSSRFVGEHLDDVLTRLGLDRFGNLVENEDAIFGRAPRVEDHTIEDNRHWRDIANEAGSKMLAKMDVVLDRNRERLNETAVANGELF